MGQVNLGRVVGPAGANGTTPHIGEDGNWHLGAINTGVKAQGEMGGVGMPGVNGTNGITPHIGANGNWFIGTADTGVKAATAPGVNGTNGITPHIGTNGNWFIGSTDTGTFASGPSVPGGFIIRDLSEFSEIRCLKDIINKFYNVEDLPSGGFNGTIRLYSSVGDKMVTATLFRAIDYQFNYIEFHIIGGFVRMFAGKATQYGDIIQNYSEDEASPIEAVSTGVSFGLSNWQTICTNNVIAEIFSQRT